jgi:2-polyprenyl-3-methyl-5-hydroxy-6-metoxy-1,4-benzoquinol methylase
MSVVSGDKVLQYWDEAAPSFDAIYSGAKPGWASFLDRWLRRDMYERFNWVLRNSGDVKGKSVCDLGCGTGRYVIAYAQSGARRVLGIDGAPNMIKHATALIEQAGVAGRAEAREITILDCPQLEVFDITISVGVFDYTHDARPFLKRIRTITGDRFLATFPRLWTWRMPIRRARLRVLGCPVYFYTTKQINSLFTGAGFACRRIDRLGAIYCVVAVPSEK